MAFEGLPPIAPPRPSSSGPHGSPPGASPLAPLSLPRRRPSGSSLGAGGCRSARSTPAHSSRPPSAAGFNRPGSASGRHNSASRSGSLSRAGSASRAGSLSRPSSRMEELQDAKTEFWQDPMWFDVFAACRSITGDPPASVQARQFLEAVRAQNRGPQDKLALRGLRLNSAAVLALANQLKDSAFTRVDLSSNVLGDGSGPSLCKLLGVLPKLRWLSLSHCNLHLEAVGELCRELEASQLESLEMGRLEVLTSATVRQKTPSAEACSGRPNSFGDNGLRMLMESIRKHPKPALTSLSLCGTSLTVEAAKHLAEVLEGSSIRHLDLSCNPLAPEGVSLLLPQCEQLQTLGLTDTGCHGDQAVAALAELLERTQGLERLAIGRNQLSQEHLQQLAPYLGVSEALKYVGLESLGMSSETVEVLSQAFLSSKTPTLTELDLSHNELNAARATASLSQFASRGSLQTLRLNYNALGDAGAAELASALDPEVSPAGALQHLELSGCRISSAGAGHLFKALANNQVLQVLGLKDNYLDDKLDMDLLEQCKVLQDLQVTGNRLSQGALHRLNQAIANNRDMAKHGKTYALRSTMNTLLFQEVKVNEQRQLVNEASAEITSRRTATVEAVKELALFRKSSHATQSALTAEINQSREELAEKRRELTHTRQDLEDASRKYELLHQELKGQLRDSEEDLADLQAQAEELQQKLKDRRHQHPLEVIGVRDQIKAAEVDTQLFHEKHRHLKQQLRQLQEKSLLDFRP